MKLCIVTAIAAKGNGQGQVNYEVVWEALRRGHKVMLIASSIEPDLQQHHQVNWIPITVKHLPSALLQEMIFASKSAFWLQHHRNEIDLVKVNGAVTSVKSDVNAVHFVHATWLKSTIHTSRLHKNLYGAYHWLYTQLNARWEAQSFQRTRQVIAVSQQIKREIISLGIPGQQIKVISNGVDLQEFYPGFSSRSDFGLPEGVPLALFAGDIRTPRKNLDTVLRSLVQVSNLHLVVAGETQGSPYPSMAEQLNVNQRVHFIGHCSDMPNLMQSVDMFVFPSHYEPFGMVVLEAMASGLPVIVSATAGAAEIISPESGFVLTDQTDEKCLSQILQVLSDSPQKCQLLGKAARQVAEKYSWQQQAKEYVDLFESMALKGRYEN